MKRNLFKAIVAIFLLIATLTLTVLPASASTYIGEDEEYTTGFWFWKKYYKNVPYMDYPCVLLYPDRKLSEVVPHIQNDSDRYLDTTIATSKEISISYSTTVSFNKSVGCKATVKIVEISANNGYGISGSLGLTLTRNSTITKYIYNNFPTGSYFMAPSVYAYRCHYEILQKNSGGKYVSSGLSDQIYYMPKGDLSVGTFYTTTSTTGYFISP